MGRPRKYQSPLPPCYRESHGSFFHIKKNAWRLVGKTIAEVAEDYKRIVGRGQQHKLDTLIDAAFKRMKDRKNKPLSQNSIDAYSVAVEKLKHHARAFTSPDQVQQKDAAAVKMLLADTPVMANRVLTLGRLIWNDFLESQLVAQNPFVGVKRFRTESRKRTYTWDEWNSIRANASPILQLVMDGLYLTDQRVGDVLKIDERDLLEAGIYVKQQKTKKEIVIAWNDDLRAWVASCRLTHGKVLSIDAKRARPLLRYKRGKAPSYVTMGQHWRAACAAAKVEDGHMHDGRAFSAGEAKKQGHDPQKLLGHTDAATTRIYLRDREVELVQGPKLRRVIGT